MGYRQTFKVKYKETPEFGKSYRNAISIFFIRMKQFSLKNDISKRKLIICVFGYLHSNFNIKQNFKIIEKKFNESENLQLYSYLFMKFFSANNK